MVKRKELARNPAESVERRAGTEENAGQSTRTTAQDVEALSSGLARVREAARKDRSLRFTTLLHHVTQELLRKAYFSLKREAAEGVDGVTWKEYGKDLENRLPDLHDRVQGCQYRAKPSKRAWIPKADGRKRPIGIASLEDKIVQQALKWVLQSIFEEDFKGFSYGSRPKRRQHDALDAVYVAITKRKVNWVLDADIEGFFDRLNHDWLMKFVGHRVADLRIHRLLKKFLRAGVSEDGEWSKTEVGTPQGAVISPLLANIYLHYVLDLWVEKWRKEQARGEVYIVRYVDDFVMGFQYRSDGERFQQALRDRLAQFGLNLNEEKTRLIEFGRFAESDRRDKGNGKPETFDFLGFTHICSKRRSNGSFKLHRITIKKRVRATLKRIREVLMKKITLPVPEQGRWIRSVLTGYFNYHAIPGNQATLDCIRAETCKAWRWVLKRRSQNARKNWEQMKSLFKTWIPHTRIRHPYPTQRLVVDPM